MGAFLIYNWSEENPNQEFLGLTPKNNIPNKAYNPIVLY